MATLRIVLRLPGGAALAACRQGYAKPGRYRLCPQGYSICLVFLKLFERVYSPLTAGLLRPYRADSKLQDHKRTQLDRLYQKIADDLDELLYAAGLKAA
jgi:hypothetical protein